MKRLISLLLALLLIFSLAGCDGAGDRIANGGSDAAGNAALSELWAQLAGVWNGVGDCAGNYVLFTVQEGKPCFTAGTLAGGHILSGTVTEFGGSDGDYTLVVSVPAIAATDAQDAREAQEITVYLGSEHAAESWILASDHAGDGSIREFHYAAGSLEEIGSSAYPGGVDTAKPAASASYSAWNALDGVWVAKTGDSIWFVQFSREDTELVFAAGIPFSGYAMRGTVTGFEEDDAQTLWLATVHFAAVAASELEEGRAETDATVRIDHSDLSAGTIRATNLAGDGAFAVFTRMADTLEGLDYDRVMKL